MADNLKLRNLVWCLVLLAVSFISSITFSYDFGGIRHGIHSIYFWTMGFSFLGVMTLFILLGYGKLRKINFSLVLLTFFVLLMVHLASSIMLKSTY